MSQDNVGTEVAPAARQETTQDTIDPAGNESPTNTNNNTVDAGTQAKAPTKAQQWKKKSTKVAGRALNSSKTYVQNYNHAKVPSLEYSERDPEHIHSDLKVHFRDVIAEPEGAHSFATVWGTSFKTYSISKFWCYRILTAVLGIPFALFWGIYFAVLAFLNVWFVVPFVKAFVIQMKFISKIWALLVGTFLDPFFTSIGRIFSAIRVNLTMNRA